MKGMCNETTCCLDYQANASYWYVWLRSILLKTVHSARVANRSSTMGIGYLSKVETGLTVYSHIRTLTLSGLSNENTVEFILS